MNLTRKSVTEKAGLPRAIQAYVRFLARSTTGQREADLCLWGKVVDESN